MGTTTMGTGLTTGVGRVGISSVTVWHATVVPTATAAAIRNRRMLPPSG
jgi:hypothetical protein